MSLTLKHLDQAGVTPNPALAGADDWSTLAKASSRTIQPAVDRDPEAPWLRALFADFVQFR